MTRHPSPDAPGPRTTAATFLKRKLPCGALALFGVLGGHEARRLCKTRAPGQRAYSSQGSGTGTSQVVYVMRSFRNNTILYQENNGHTPDTHDNPTLQSHRFSASFGARSPSLISAASGTSMVDGRLWLPARLLAIRVPVSAILAPRSMLPRRLTLPLRVRRLPVSATRRSMLPRLVVEFRRLSGSVGECEWSLCGIYNTVGDPNDEESDGGGTEG